MIDDNNMTQNKIFSNTYLSKMALLCPQEFINGRITKRDLDKHWHGLGAKMGKSHSDGELELRRAELPGDINVLIICMPSPEVTLDAFFIGVATHRSHKLFSTKGEWLRYYILALNFDERAADKKYFFCEYGPRDPLPKLEFRGLLPSPDIELFLRAIEIQVCGSSDQVSTAINAFGKPSGNVVDYIAGRAIINANGISNHVSVLFSLALVLAKKLGEEDRVRFSQWAGLSQKEWTSTHQEQFSFTFIYYLYEVKAGTVEAPQALKKATDLLGPEGPPPLIRPITKEIEDMFYRLHIHGQS